MNDLVFIRFGSHRAREYGLDALDRRPQAFFSLRRETGTGGVYQLTGEEITKLRAGSRRQSFTVLRKPYDDLMKCWSI